MAPLYDQEFILHLVNTARSTLCSIPLCSITRLPYTQAMVYHLRSISCGLILAPDIQHEHCDSLPFGTQHLALQHHVQHSPHCFRLGVGNFCYTTMQNGCKWNGASPRWIHWRRKATTILVRSIRYCRFLVGQVHEWQILYLLQISKEDMVYGNDLPTFLTLFFQASDGTGICRYTVNPSDEDTTESQIQKFCSTWGRTDLYLMRHTLYTVSRFHSSPKITYQTS